MDAQWASGPALQTYRAVSTAWTCTSQDPRQQNGRDCLPPVARTKVLRAQGQRGRENSTIAPDGHPLVGKTSIVTSDICPVTSIVAVHKNGLRSSRLLANLTIVRAILCNERKTASAGKSHRGLNSFGARKLPYCCCLGFRNYQRRRILGDRGIGNCLFYTLEDALRRGLASQIAVVGPTCDEAVFKFDRR